MGAADGQGDRGTHGEHRPLFSDLKSKVVTFIVLR